MEAAEPHFRRTHYEPRIEVIYKSTIFKKGSFGLLPQRTCMTSSVNCLEYIVQKGKTSSNSQSAAPTLGRETPRYKERRFTPEKVDADSNQPQESQAAYISPQLTILGLTAERTEPEEEPRASISFTTCIDSASATSPKTTCLPSSHEVTTVVMKNWEPLLQGENVSIGYSRMSKKDDHRVTYVLGPALAMESRPGRSCLSLKFSSGNFSP